MMVLGIIINPFVGMTMVVIFLGTLYLLKKISKEVFVEINKNILNLSYKIKRGEQEALIKMPLGMILLNERNEIEWVNPYMQNHLANYNEVLGQPISVVEPDLSEQLKKSKNNQAETIKWQDKTFKVTFKKIYGLFI